MYKGYKVLIVSQGSIGERHANLLQQCDAQIAVVTKFDTRFKRYDTIQNGLRDMQPDFCIIASPTYQHYSDIQDLLKFGFMGKILVEKPLFAYKNQEVQNALSNVFVAYNIRFHPLVQDLKNYIKGKKILSVRAYAGQYLPEWRTNQNYDKSYSAQRMQGGGVLRDLSHEIDYLCHLFGDISSVASLGGKISDLKIDSDDYWSIIGLIDSSIHFSLSLSYLDRNYGRNVLIETVEDTICVDLIKNVLHINKKERNLNVDKDASYLAMYEDFIVQSTPSLLCTYNEAMNVMNIIDAIEQSNTLKKWIQV